MKQDAKRYSFSLIILILGIGIIIGGILTMCLYHFMIWQSYVIIGVIMAIALWVILKTLFSKSLRHHNIPIHRDDFSDRQE